MAIARRDPFPVLGFVAYGPWIALHVLAVGDIPGTLANYYPFPMLIGMFWPLLAPRDKATPWLVLAMVALSWMGLDRQHNPGGIDIPGSFARVPSLSMQRDTDRAVEQLVHAPALGRIIADAAVVSLQEDAFDNAMTILDWKGAEPDTILYFAHGYQAEKAAGMGETFRLTRRFRLPNTQLRAASNRDLTGIAGLVEDR